MQCSDAKEIASKIEGFREIHHSLLHWWKFSCKGFCDFGTNINLMPLSIYKKLGLEEVKPITVKLQVANRSYIFPKEEIENILVKIDKFICQKEFVILNMEEDKDVSLIMGQLFLTK